MKTRDILAVFNRGRISSLALARSDVARVALSAEVQTNWMPRALGPMMLRPGLEYLGNSLDDGADIPFAYATEDTANLELTPSTLRVWSDGDNLVTRPSVSATVTNGDFTTNLTGWTDSDESGAASTWVSGAMQLLGTGINYAKRSQQITVTETGVKHALRITVTRGPVILRVGTTAGDDDVFRQAVLRTGTHSIAFIPSADFYIEFSSRLNYPVLIDGCQIESSGVMTLPTPWADVDTCKAVRWAQSSDVVFIACDGYQQRRIERRDNDSWSIAVYDSSDGPFLTENTSRTTLAASAITGSVTLTASSPVFQSGHVGALFRVVSQGQLVSSSIATDNAWTNSIRVTGVGTGRKFTVSRTGTWVGTVTLQRSIGAEGAWADVTTYTGNGSISFDDGLDNSIVYYRLGFDTGDYTSGSATLSLNFDAGSITGVVRVVGYTSATSASAVVLTDLGGTDPTDSWSEGAWSDVQGWPSSVTLSEGRLWWHGQGRNYGSVSDAYTSFDPDYEGDAGPINRLAGEGAVGRINWGLSLQRLIVGADGGEYSVRSNSFDEPITPSNYNVKRPSTKGSAPVPAVDADGRGYFVGRSETAIYEARYDAQTYDFTSQNMTLLCPEVGEETFVRIAVQQFPDVRLHCVRADGTVGVLIHDPAEDVLAWVDVETEGFVEDVQVLPARLEDQVYYRVRRTVNGATVRYRERWALETECRGGALSKIADSHITGTGAVSGLDHLEGETVVVWADGADMGSHVVSSGALPTLTGTFATWCAGLGYQARYRSAKMTGQTQMGMALTQRSRINKIGMILAYTHAQGLSFGPSFDVLDDLPMVENGADVDADAVWQSYDEDMIEFPGDWDTDSRICLVANAPRPCTVLAAVMNVDKHDHD